MRFTILVKLITNLPAVSHRVRSGNFLGDLFALLFRNVGTLLVVSGPGADVLVDGGALLLVLLVALLPRGGLAQPLGPGVALLLVHRGAHLLLLLLVLCIPKGHILCPTVDGWC